MIHNIRPFSGHTPQIADDCYIDPAAQVIGQVSIAEQASIWPCAVLRGDVNFIQIGKMSNIQDLSMLHVTHRHDKNPDGAPLVIGEYVTIGHHVTLHGCTIGNEVLVGMGSIILDNVVIESNVLIGAGSLVPPGKHLASGFLYLGNPIKQIRALTTEELAFFRYSATHYWQLAQQYEIHQ